MYWYNLYIVGRAEQMICVYWELLKKLKMMCDQTEIMYFIREKNKNII